MNWFGKKQEKQKTRFQNVQEAIAHYLSQPGLGAMASYTIYKHHKHPGSTLVIGSLPAEYDDTPYDTIFDGHRVKTVGEYKQALKKFYRYRG